ncbi:interleukin 15, like isoform 3-T3 [Pholidichthys leucotaenia]
MLSERSAVATVFLCFVGLLADSSRPVRPPNMCSRDIFNLVNRLLSGGGNCQKWPDCHLYTPSTQDFQQNCSLGTLTCFCVELSVLAEESEQCHGPLVKLKKSLEKLSNSVRQLQSQKLMTAGAARAEPRNDTGQQSECLQCELLPQKDPENFLRDLLSLIQTINEEKCHQPANRPR